MRRRLDVLHASAPGQVFRSNERPVPAVVPGDVKWAVVRSRPNHAFFQGRFRDRVERAEEFFACNVPSDRLATDTLTATWMSREIR